METVLAIDAGTLSVRAGLFDRDGQLIGLASAPLTIRYPCAGWAEYQFSEIWNAVKIAIKDVVSTNPKAASGLRAIAVDATSSLFLDLHPARNSAPDGDVICWMDHRAESVIEDIHQTKHPYLDIVGGSMSPEHYLPKLLWLKRNAPDKYRRLKTIRDLSDAISYQLTGVDRHSICGLACKLPYLPGDTSPWQTDLLDVLDMSDLLDLGSLRETPGQVGRPCAVVTADIASELGIPDDAVVAFGLIDAEAGALGVMGKDFFDTMDWRLMLIGGTSTNYMTFSSEKRLIPGIWGPFKDAVFADIWMHEGGQSLSGAALDAVLDHHPAGPGSASSEHHRVVATHVLEIIEREGPNFSPLRHIVPDWLGNRSPLGDGHARALVTGLGVEDNYRSCLEHYYATARGLVLQSRQVIEHFNRFGFQISEVSLSGGQLKNELMRKLYKDALGFTTFIPDVKEPVLLGTAMVAASAANFYPDLQGAVAGMSPNFIRQTPDPQSRQTYDKAYEIYLLLFETRNRIERLAKSL